MAAAEPNPTGLDRREYHRARYFAEVEITSGRAKLRARTSDISLGGMLLETENPLCLGTEFQARLWLEKNVALEANCVVKQVVPSVCMGVEFTALRPADQVRLRRLVERLPH